MAKKFQRYSPKVYHIYIRTYTLIYTHIHILKKVTSKTHPPKLPFNDSWPHQIASSLRGVVSARPKAPASAGWTFHALGTEKTQCPTSSFSLLFCWGWFWIFDSFFLDGKIFMPSFPCLKGSCWNQDFYSAFGDFLTGIQVWGQRNKSTSCLGFPMSFFTSNLTPPKKTGGFVHSSYQVAISKDFSKSNS